MAKKTNTKINKKSKVKEEVVEEKKIKENQKTKKSEKQESRVKSQERTKTTKKKIESKKEKAESKKTEEKAEKVEKKKEKKTTTLKTQKKTEIANDKKTERKETKVTVSKKKSQEEAEKKEAEEAERQRKADEKEEAKAKKALAKKIANAKAPTSMEELLELTETEIRVPKRGDVVEGVVTDVNKKMVLVDIGAKTEGMVIDKEYDATKELIGDLAVGDTVSVYIASPENDRGQILLSLKRAAIDRKWQQFAEYMETGKTVEVNGIEVNRGGLIVMAEGIRGFVPSSQFGKDYLGRMDQLLEKTFEVAVIEVDKEKNRLIFSEREVSEAEEIQNKNKALSIIEIDGIYEGIVSGIMPFGAFVTVTVPLEGEKEKVGQIEGLVHISEISWEKVNDPNDYFTQGDKVKIKVLGVDNGKLNLSVKQLSEDPWIKILKKYEPGTIVKGKVTRVEPFGVFVTLEPGVDGLIHISKIEAGKEPEVGKDIDVVVDSVDVENRRMSLGMVLTELPVMYK